MFRCQSDDVADCAELHLVAGGGQGGLFPVQVPHGGAGAADQLPAAGRAARVHGRIVPGQRHRTGGHGGARRAAPRHLEPLVLPHHVAEAGGEAGEGHGPDLAGVGGDDAVGSEAGQLPHLGEVLAVVHGVDDHQLAVPLRGGGEVELEQPRGDPPGRYRRIRCDQHRLGRGKDVQLARQRVLKEQGLQCQHVLGSGDFGQYRAGSHRPYGTHFVNCRVL